MTTGLCQRCDFKQLASATTTSISPLIPKFDFESQSSRSFRSFGARCSFTVTVQKIEAEEQRSAKAQVFDPKNPQNPPQKTPLFHSCHDTC